MFKTGFTFTSLITTIKPQSIKTTYFGLNQKSSLLITNGNLLSVRSFAEPKKGDTKGNYIC